MERELSERTIEITADYLHFPIKKNGKKNYITLFARGKILHEFYFALTGEVPDYYVFFYVGHLRGQKLTVTLPQPAEIDGTAALAAILQGGSCQEESSLYPDLYRERLRPAYHFSPRRGRSGNPCGLIYAGGKYHLYFQYNPFSADSDAVNGTWGHAESEDLVHWTERNAVIFPENRFYRIAGGSCAIDFNNTLGKGHGTVLAVYTGLASENFTEDKSDGRYANIGQNLAYSTDGGNTFTPLPQNPVLFADADWQDPFLFWHAPAEKWILAVAEMRENRRGVSFYASENLSDWTCTSRLEGLYACPNLYQIKVENEYIYKWVLSDASGRFLVGDFDGCTFLPESEITATDPGSDFYAGKNWLNSPDGRIFNIGRFWDDVSEEGVFSFSRGMTITTELKLLRVPDGYRLYRTPIAELQLLRKNSKKIKTSVKSGAPYTFTLTEPCEIQITLHKAKGTVRFTI